jgi:hypothetical protein
VSAPTIQSTQEEYDSTQCAIGRLEVTAAELDAVLRVLQNRRDILREQIEEANDGRS